MLHFGGASLAAGSALLIGVYVAMVSGAASLLVVPAVPAAPAGTPSAPGRAANLEAAEPLLAHLLHVSAWALLACGIAALGIGWLLAATVLHPLRRITAAASRIAAGNLHERVNLSGPNDELKRLADTFDDMLARLESSFDAQRRFTANASHELLTPLATTRTILEVAALQTRTPESTELTTRLLALNERSEQLVDAMLMLARANHSAVRWQTVDLAAVVDEAVGRITDEAARRGVTIGTDLQAAVVSADPLLCAHLADNLLANAVRHNHVDGSVTVSVAAVAGGPASGNDALLTVMNTGPAVPDVTCLFEPFRRGPGRSREPGGPPGHGLGLGIVEAVARAHSATVDVTPRPTGGLTVIVRLPGRPVAPARRS